MAEEEKKKKTTRKVGFFDESDQPADPCAVEIQPALQEEEGWAKVEDGGETEDAGCDTASE